MFRVAVVGHSQVPHDVGDHIEGTVVDFYRKPGGKVASRLRRRTPLHGSANPAPRAVNVSKSSVSKSSVPKPSVSTQVSVSVPTFVASSSNFEGFPIPIASFSNATLTDAITVTALSTPFRVSDSEQVISYPASPNVLWYPLQFFKVAKCQFQ